MRESNYRSRVVKLLASVCAFPVENEVADGAPDVCTTIGWIEMKRAARPRSSESRVCVEVRNSQRVWHRRWRAHGGRSFFLTVISDADWYLHDGRWGAEHLGQADWQTFHDSAIANWTGGPSGDALIRAIVTYRS